MQLSHYISIAAILLCSACSRNTPHCIDSKIEDFKSTAACDSAKVEKFKLDGNFYYAFEEEMCCCDMQSFWYDEDCNLVCTTGGIAPSVNECDIDIASAEFVETLWEK